MTGIKDTDIKIVRDETAAVVTVKKVTVDKKDNTKVTIETYEALTDGKAYTVTYTAADEAKTESTAHFTATSGVVADIALNTYTIPANTPTEIKYQTLDANGVIIAEAGIGSSAANNMEISVENFNGYQNNDELMLYKTGDTATIKVVYHTYKYNNTDGKEDGKVERTFTVTAVDQSSVIETYDYSIAEAGAAIDFKRDKLVQQIALDDDKLADPHAYFSFRTAAGKDITSSLDYTVSSGNENVLLASGTVAGGAKLTPVGAGATYLVIKNASGTVVTTLPINVVAKRTLSTMTVDKSNVTVAEQTSGAGDEKITVAVMDQYSDNYSKYSVDQPVLRSSNNPGNLSVTAAKGADHKTVVTVSAASGANVGTYSYTMDLIDSENANNVKKVSFSVTVSKVLSNQSYALVMMKGTDVVSKIDTTVTTDAYSATTLVPTIVTKNNGSITGVAGAEIVSISAIKLTKNGVTVDNTKGIYAPTTDGAASDAKVIVSSTSNGIIKKNLTAGTYTVSFKATINNGTANKVQDMSTSFVVEDSQKVFEVSVKKESVANGKATLADVFEDTDYATFTYAGHDLDKTEYAYSYDSADTTKINSNSIRVNKVTMNVVLPGTNGKTVQMTTAVNRTFTFGNAISTPDVVKTAIAAVEKKYVAGTTNSAIIADYYDAKISFNQLTDSEKTTALTASMAAIKTNAENTAVNIVKDVAAGGASNLNLDVFRILDVTDAAAGNLAAYKEAMISNAPAFTVLSSAASAKTALQTLVTEINALAGVAVVVNDSDSAQIDVTAAVAGLKYATTDIEDPDTSATALTKDTTVNITVKNDADGTLVLSHTTYKLTYNVTDGDSEATAAASIGTKAYDTV